MMKTPSVSECAEAIGIPSGEWKSRCFEIASRIVAAGVVEGHPVYGSWRGPVAEGSFFESGPKMYFRHGWIAMRDGSVVDPTRWVFENVKPYIYHGPSDHYDEGSNILRKATIGSAPEWDPEEEQVRIRQHELATAPFQWLEKALRLDDCLMHDRYEPGTVTKEQLAWIAHCDPREMDGHAPAVFKYLESIGMKVMVPLDNWRMAERMASGDGG